MISKRLAHEFDFYSLQEGEQYFKRKKVRFVRRAGDIVHYAVQGNRRTPYDVYLNCGDAENDHLIETSCCCPRAADGDSCKHVWASLLAVNSLALWGPPGTGSLNLSPVYAEEVDFETEMDEIELELDDELNEVVIQTTATTVARIPSVQSIAQQSLSSHGLIPAGPTAPSLPGLPADNVWMSALQGIRSDRQIVRPLVHSLDTQIWYAINATRSVSENQVALDLFTRTLGPEGVLSKPKPVDTKYQAIAAATTRVEREFLTQQLSNPYQDFDWRRRHTTTRKRESELSLEPEVAESLFPRLAATGRLTWILEAKQPWENVQPIRWDAMPYRFQLTAERLPDESGWTVRGELATYDGSVTAPLSDIIIMVGQLVLFKDRIGMLADESDSPWIATLAPRPWVVTNDQRGAFLQYLSTVSPSPVTRFPDEFCSVATIDPVAVLMVDLNPAGKKSTITARLKYQYGEGRVAAGEALEMVFDQTNGVLYNRNRIAERELFRKSQSIPAEALKTQTTGYWDGVSELRCELNHFPDLARQLSDAGWIVEANNERLRTSGSLKLSVTSSSPSNIDWFDLDGQVDFEYGSTTLPKLLDAVRRGEKTIRLDDGSIGLLPEDWIKRFGRMADLGNTENGQIRFQSSQALLLDALLASDQKASVDLGFKSLREKLRKTHKVKAITHPKGFGGSLRDYQKHGQGWLACLHELRLGGCLADDMGLGKTIQVLAWLETLRQRQLKDGSEKRPSLVVVPKSLVFNWVAEAAKFTPTLRVLNFTGKERVGLEDLAEIDLVVTTYGTMRNDIEKLREIDFEYLILDEAQAIKNSTAQAAKAARLLKGRHRLAMSGTPIENHIGELWSLFEFLNPGLLGNSTAFQRVARGGASEPESLQWLSKAIAPFVLRRTKGQVLKELPEKSEQVLYCEMSPKHEKLYNELRDHYRASLTQTVSEKGLANSKIHVLEALLRLRQAACHPGLLDVTAKKELGPKLEELLGRLREITEEGHKALVFSQFTSFLAILELHLKKEKIPYLYLDGQTSLKDRQARVEQFQSDGSKTPLFLISLKAGGSGLNLTAADYVFLLDPWWNPAVENQAIDRTHRIGQTRKVHACRLITRGTVEEKVLELQKQKKHLAEAILSIDGSLLQKMSWEDLQLLFS